MREAEVRAGVERALRRALERLGAFAHCDAALDRVSARIDLDAVASGAELEQRVADAIVAAVARRAGGSRWRS